MPYKHTWEPYGIYRKFDGELTGKEFLQAVQEVEGDSRFDSIRYVINDYLDTANIEISTNEVNLIAAIDNAAYISNPNIVIAQVTTNPIMEKIIAIYTQTPVKSPYLSINFSYLEEAREWIHKNTS